METRTIDVADGIVQLTTYVADIDFSFNQYLVLGDEPLLFHTGRRISGRIPVVVATPRSVGRWPV